MARKTNHEIRAGTWPVSSMGSAYRIRSLAMASDQNFALPWVLSGRLTLPPEYADIPENVDMSRQGIGFLEGQLGFSFMSFGMYKAWNTAHLPNGAKWALVTIGTYDENDELVYLNCTLWRPSALREGTKYGVAGYEEVIFKYVAGTIIT